MSTTLIVEEIRKKTEVLIKVKQDLSIQNKRLQEEIIVLKQNSIREQQEIEDVKSRLKIVKMAKSLDSVDEKSTDAKYKINELVKEIDKCIDMLNS